MITGGYAVNKRAWLKPFAGEMTTRLHAMRHRQVTDAVHEAGGAIALQVLHAGRYAYHPFSRRRVGHEVADHAVLPARPLDARRRTAPSTTSPARSCWRARPATTPSR